MILSLSFVSTRGQSAAGAHNPASTNTATLTLRRFEERYRNSGSLEANFLERYSENGTQVRVEAGKAYFLRPGKMRWEYEKPERSLFLVDGKFVWFYALCPGRSHCHADARQEER